jgi:hypothetical protein
MADVDENENVEGNRNNLKKNDLPNKTILKSFLEIVFKNR